MVVEGWPIIQQRTAARAGTCHRRFRLFGAAGTTAIAKPLGAGRHPQQADAVS